MSSTVDAALMSALLQLDLAPRNPAQTPHEALNGHRFDRRALDQATNPDAWPPCARRNLHASPSPKEALIRFFTRCQHVISRHVGLSFAISRGRRRSKGLEERAARRAETAAASPSCRRASTGRRAGWRRARPSAAMRSFAAAQTHRPAAGFRVCGRAPLGLLCRWARRAWGPTPRSSVPLIG